MKANVVLAGGGAKGAVLAGCVNAAITKGVLPAGFGGTSAGAIVAFLAAIGYRGDALRSLVIDTTLADLLDDGGAAIDGITRDLGWLGTRLAAGTDLGIGGLLGLVAGVGWCEGSALVRDLGRAIARWPRSILARCPGLAGFRPPPQSELPQRWTPIRVTRLLVTRLGLHDGRALRRWLADRIVEWGLATADEAATLTFAELAEKPGCVPLRVVATDARSRRPVVFGDGDHAALPVIDAVVASARFPLLFRPADLAGMCLTDGGLSSNLPAFLFEDAHAATGVRTLAFDLVEEPAREGSGGAERDGVNYLRSLASCAVEASDVLLRRSTAGCSGRAWEACGVAVADVQEGRERPEDWGMTAAQYAKIPRRVRAIISVPILDDPETSRPAMHPLGTISVDCRTALSDTGWVDESGSMQGQHVVDQEVEDILWAWSRVIHALLIRAA